MSKCDACGSSKTCKYHGESKFYHKDDGTPVIALLGQPNSGKSTIFNLITGSHQHVGNWPGKTVDQKEGEFKWNGQKMILADLPGSYSLSAGSDEEVITREYISAGNADLILVMADASQLKRSLYMLADFAGTKVPAILVLNMMDVAEGQGIRIDTEKLSKKLGIPVVPMSAIRKKDYKKLYEAIEDGLENRRMIAHAKMDSVTEKMEYIDALLADVMIASKTGKRAYTKFDRIALSPVRGKIIAIGIILGVFFAAMLFAGIFGGLAGVIIKLLAGGVQSLLEGWHVPELLISLICDVLFNVVYFAVMMASFVLGISLGFNLMEETGYLARISFLFDPTMSKVGLQGKTIMPFFMGLGCTIAGTTGTRVVDNWGQRVLAIAMSWAVPCGATLSVVPMLAMALFGNTGGFLVIVSIFVVMIMELPPYHKPNVRNTLYVTFERTVDIFMRALRVITIVSVVFFVLTYGFGGSAETSILYQLGVIIEPMTLFFGMKWEAFLAFLASAISKESLLGVLNTLYGTGGSIVSSTFGAKAGGGSSSAVASLLSDHFTKAQGLAFIYAISFNMPCVSALAATSRETHSVKWTAKIGVFYTVSALLISCVVYHIGLLIF